MAFGWGAAVLLLLLPAAAQAQSGDGVTDTEPRIRCTSDLMRDGSTLTCKLIGGIEDDDDEAGDIEKMTVCYEDNLSQRKICLEDFGDTVTSTDLRYTVVYNVTVHLKRGGKIKTTVYTNKIVKPKSPQVWNVTFIQETNQAVINIRIPYKEDYLKIENQLFQLHIWTAGSMEMIQNVSSDSVIIDLEHLQRNAEHHVQVRAIPNKHLQGTWSEWSEPVTFFTPAVQTPTDDRREMYTLILCLVPFVVVTSSVVFFWKNKAYVWPNIPHPKHTLVQICKPNKGLLLNFKPEVFSALKVNPTEKTDEQSSDEAEPSVPAAAAAADGTQSNHACSTQSSDCSRSTTSVSTEELELSALLSRSSSEGEDSLESTSPSPINALQLGESPDTPQPERSRGREAEPYVTMSSFYQIK
ncbi:interleukin-7 receptor subunit alpha-like [Micropterus salmoides]|uniref:interleukin-7 receptor subunit alpha-like n=1 Tax=Micropterus salmoides TaxID=27706 RepID=UPI0018EB1887|nr:interleukin-7 receptor subunit alpha-like [Micropterus salmoides]